MVGFDGFSVGLDGLGDVGAALQQAATDHQAVGDDLTKMAPVDDDAFGEYGAPAAYRSFLRSWEREVSTAVAALRETSGGVDDSKQRYGTADDQLAQAAQTLRPPFEMGRP